MCLRAWWNKIQLWLQTRKGVCVYHLAYYLWLFINDLIHWNSSLPAKQQGSLPRRAPWLLLFGKLSCQWPYLLCQWWFMLAATTLLQPQVHLHQGLVSYCQMSWWCALICLEGRELNTEIFKVIADFRWDYCLTQIDGYLWLRVYSHTTVRLCLGAKC